MSDRVGLAHTVAKMRALSLTAVLFKVSAAWTLSAHASFDTHSHSPPIVVKLVLFLSRLRLP